MKTKVVNKAVPDQIFFPPSDHGVCNLYFHEYKKIKYHKATLISENKTNFHIFRKYDHSSCFQGQVPPYLHSCITTTFLASMDHLFCFQGLHSLLSEKRTTYLAFRDRDQWGHFPYYDDHCFVYILQWIAPKMGRSYINRGWSYDKKVEKTRLIL